MDALELLRRFCIGDPTLVDESGEMWLELDARTAALVRIGALIAASAPAPSVRSAVDGAIAAGSTLHEIVAVLDGCVAIVGLPRVVTAAPRIAAALGVDEDLVGDDDR